MSGGATGDAGAATQFIGGAGRGHVPEHGGVQSLSRSPEVRRRGLGEGKARPDWL